MRFFSKARPLESEIGFNLISAKVQCLNQLCQSMNASAVSQMGWILCVFNIAAYILIS
ncbi:hypothetical protein [Coxiella-like endosymbiont of Rhipicephalus sanguineus]|uniref:hypothetical protein n=1 Tax=Coxiella-like endosymbiont of Rhipicephalus sanguineus TaxID=1955402 RepID=UPI0020421CDA|nr:hypothetical protein [Coxiella-like endosymbiont of Rhipicephalus sanguineus]